MEVEFAAQAANFTVLIAALMLPLGRSRGPQPPPVLKARFCGRSSIEGEGALLRHEF